VFAGNHIPKIGAIRVTAAHLVASVLAAVFAFAAVVAVRESLRLICGERVFARVSMAAQSLLIVALTTLLLLAVGQTPGVYSTWLRPDLALQPVTPFAMPPLWFLGLAETLNGNVIVLAPTRGIVLDDDLSRAYIGAQPMFLRLALTGLAATAGTLLVGGLAYLWNSRRLPAPPPRARSARRPFSGILTALAMRFIVRDPLSQAGFFFTLRVLFRSAPQRLAMAVGVAVALSLTIAIAGGFGLESGRVLADVPLSAWALQPLVLIALLAAFRHTMAVPAELRANWVFRQCWPGRLREYLIGVERAGVLAVATPAVLSLMPIHVLVLGTDAALFHAVNGVGLSMALVALIVSTQTVPPFVSSYVRRGNVKSLGPIFLMGVLAFAFSAAAVERAAFATVRGIVLHAAAVFGATIVVHLVSARRTKQLAPMAADVPEPTAQTLGLSG
jgi:hypothetical protein